MNLIEYFFYDYLLLSFVSVFFLNYFAIKLWYLYGHKFSLTHREEVQTIHKSSIGVPRFGGLLIIVNLLLQMYFGPDFFSNMLVYKLIIFSLPIVLIATYEDFFYANSAFTRLFSMIVSIALLFIFSDIPLPYIEVPVIDEFINTGYYPYLFYALALTLLINGMNVIDGVNGLTPVTAIAALLTLSCLAYFSNDTYILSAALIIVMPTLIFSIFNYPSGKVFLGDTGAYWLGWSLGILTITFYGRNPTLPTWGAWLLLFYPTFEMMFSTIRKLSLRRSPLKPDPEHLHLLMYFKINANIYDNLSANNRVMPLLSIFCILPPAFLIYAYNDVGLIIASLIFFISSYILIYLYLLKSVALNK